MEAVHKGWPSLPKAERDTTLLTPQDIRDRREPDEYLHGFIAVKTYGNYTDAFPA
jgi:hypothetical protein